MKRRIIIAATLLITLFIGGSIYLTEYALHVQKPKNWRELTMEFLSQDSATVAWIDSLEQCNALKDTFITSNVDGSRLHAYYVEGRDTSARCVILLHGYTDNALCTAIIARAYHQQLGYNLLLPDLHGHGYSEGDYIQMGWIDRYDVKQWIDAGIAKWGEDSRFVIHGISMGAATTMNISGEPDIPPNVRCYVEDCGYTSVWDQFEKELKEDFHLPTFPLLYGASLYTKLRLGWSFSEASPIQQVAKCLLPMLFIHGDQDSYIPVSMVYNLYDAKPSPKEIWIAPGAEHANAFSHNTQEYSWHLFDFLGKYMK